jgi:cell division protein FtsI/penicillin-binding protein 2
MKEEYYEIIDDEKIEKDNFKSIKELTKYTKILSKGNNLLFVLNNHQEIRMKSSKTLFKISMLIGNLPEENVSFTIYIDQDQEDEQGEEKTSKKDILHSKKKLPISSPTKKEEEKKEKPSSPSSFYLPDDIKESQALEIYKKGNVIGYNHGLFKKIWKNLYIITLLTSSSNFITLLVYSYIIITEQNYVTLGLDVLSLLTLGLMIFTSASGHKKLNSKKK